MDLGTVNFDDLFDFSPDPPQNHDRERGDVAESYDRSREVPDRSRQINDNYDMRGEDMETMRLNGDWNGVRQTSVITSHISQSLPSQSHESEMMVRQLWEDLPDGQEEGGRSGEVARRGRGRGRLGDMRVKLERSRQSARECRARKKLRYQYLDDMIAEREGANEKLRNEMMMLVGWCQELDMGRLPEGFQEYIKRPIEG